MRFIGFSLVAFLMCGLLNADYVQKYEGIIKAEYEEFLPLIQTLLPENPVVIEAGGHYGTDTVRFARAWPNGTIITFEPNPGAFSKLVMNTWKYKNVRAVPMALAHYDGEAVLNVCYGSTGDNPLFEGASSLLEAADHMAVHYQGPKIRVPCNTLDRWCQENEIDNVDFIWLDLEGMELQVLRSSPKILKTLKAVLVETNFQEFRKGMTQYNQIKEFLLASGFVLLCHSYTEGWQGDAIFIRE